MGFLPRLQPVPHRCDLTGHREARGGRHRGEPARAGGGEQDRAAGRVGLAAGRKNPQESCMNFDYTPKVQDLARVPFACRSLTFDGANFWTNHRAANEIVSFAQPH